MRDDRTAAIETVAQLRAFFSAVLRMPLSFKALGIESPDIDTMVERAFKKSKHPVTVKIICEPA